MKLGLPVQVPWLGETVPRLKPAGNVSVTLTAVASDGPALFTVIVYVPVDWPATTLVTPSVLVIERSASASTVVVAVASLFAGTGSDVELETVALLTRIVPSGTSASTVAVITIVWVSPGTIVPSTRVPVQGVEAPPSRL